MSKRFRVVLKRLDLDLTLSPYVLRHSSIIRQIRSNTPLRIIAFEHDTSVQEIETTYARYLNNAKDDLSRKGLLADDAPPVDNVVRVGATIAATGPRRSQRQRPGLTNPVGSTHGQG